MNEKFKGIIPAFMTAFSDDCNSIERHKCELLAKRLIAAGVHGLYVGGSSGEMVLCSVKERIELLETVMGVSQGKTIIAHIGALSAADSVELAKHAASVKADAISSVTPLYYKYSFKEIRHYYSRIAEESGLPVIIYNIPALSGTTLNFEQLSELLSLDGIEGMKFTSSDFFQLNRLKAEFPDKVIYNGSDEMLLSGLAAGADGGIGTTYNFMPDIMLAIYRLFRENRMDEALRAQSLADRLIASLLKVSGIPASKQMLAFCGLDYGKCREPFLPLTEEEKEMLYREVFCVLERERTSFRS